MTGRQFEKWMKARRLRVSEIASATGLDPNTVYAFRREEPTRRTTKDILIRFVSEYDQAGFKPKAAVG